MKDLSFAGKNGAGFRSLRCSGPAVPLRSILI